MSDWQLHTDTHVDLQLGAAGTVEGFKSFDMPIGQTQVADAHYWNAQNQPQKVTTSSIVNWNDLNGVRFQDVDAHNTLHDAWKKAVEDPNGAKENFTVTKKTRDGSDLEIWLLEGALVTSVHSTPAGATASGIAELNITIHYDNAVKQ
jgi:hypothetical protein